MFCFPKSVSTKTVVNKIRYPSCISIVSLNRCSKPGTMSSLINMFVKHITGLRSGEDTDVGVQHFDLSSPHTPVAWLSLYKAHATNEYSWCHVLIFRPQALQTRSDFPSHCFNVNPIFSHCFARTTPIEPFCFEGWNKFSVPVWRAWLSYWTLKEQLQSWQKSCTKGKRAFLLRRLSF